MPFAADQDRDLARLELRQRRQEEILEAAIRLFANQGYAATNTQQLSDELKVGKGTLYRYFASKEELFLAAVDYGMRKLREQVTRFISGVEEPLEQIRQGVRGYLAFFDEHPEFVELLIQERALFKARRRPTFFEHRERNVRRWQELYRRLIAEGRVRQMPPERITDVISDLLYGTMFINYFAGRAPNSEKQTDDILDVVLYGILSDAERMARAAVIAGRLETTEERTS